MAVIDAAFYEVIVTDRPIADNGGFLYQQPPAGTDPAMLRLMPAREVQAGDWYLGDCEQPTAAKMGRYWGVHTYCAFETAPVMDASGTSLAMDGEHFHWSPDEIVMVIPSQHVASATPAPSQAESTAAITVG
ncbi:hypothetical protein [Streptomyces sp. NBC_01601]|uniref:hypothetical protein n=1 Tax=Streptomyces sp. NBC_01601 TaxID=2975892 RepID=UPI002E2997D9|nr:hypothetical protein [Streptomyces sp. NBC_01601]